MFCLSFSPSKSKSLHQSTCYLIFLGHFQRPSFNCIHCADTALWLHLQGRKCQTDSKLWAKRSRQPLNSRAFQTILSNVSEELDLTCQLFTDSPSSLLSSPTLQPPPQTPAVSTWGLCPGNEVASGFSGQLQWDRATLLKMHSAHVEMVEDCHCGLVQKASCKQPEVYFYRNNPESADHNLMKDPNTNFQILSAGFLFITDITFPYL